MEQSLRRLRVVFDDAESFQSEYARNLVLGGVFVPTQETFELREAVEVELQLRYSGHRIAFPGEVVHLVNAELAASGATPGVALELRGSADEIRERLAPLVQYEEVAGDADEPERRGAPRFDARVLASIDVNEDSLDGHTRNLSSTGVLVSMGGDGVPVGERVQLNLEHPTSGERIEVSGRVARHLHSPETGGVCGVAVEFEPARGERERMARFIGDVERAEHARRLGGISGSIEEVGLASLVNMLGNSAPAGTLAVRHESGSEEGLIGFEGGLLRYVHCGVTSGVKALTRLLAWKRGRFEFHARLDPAPTREPPLPLEAALLEAVRQGDEFARLDLTGLGPQTRLRLRAEPQEELGKVATAILDLARTDYPLGRILDVIPEPDARIYRAVRELADQGIVSLE